jgi:hypothetical protein
MHNQRIAAALAGRPAHQVAIGKIEQPAGMAKNDASPQDALLGPVDIHFTARKAAARWMMAAKLVSVFS